MSEMKHTPGPWRVSQDELGYGEYDILACLDKGITEFHNVGIATVVDARFSDPDLGIVALHKDVCIANTRLIAAAPDLLMACKAALSYLPTKDGELKSPMPSDPDEKVQLNIANQLKAAIAKGESPCDPTPVYKRKNGHSDICDCEGCGGAG